jgi:hypothetical protein
MTGRDLTTEIKRRPLKPRLLKAVKDFAEGKIRSKAALAAMYKISPRTIARTFARPDVQELIISKAREHLAAGTARASARMVELIDSQSEASSIDAAKYVLGTSNIRPPAASPVVINNNVAVGYDIDLESERIQPDAQSPTVTIDHEPTPAQPRPATVPDAPRPPMSGMRYCGRADNGAQMFAHVGDERK